MSRWTCGSALVFAGLLSACQPVAETPTPEQSDEVATGEEVEQTGGSADNGASGDNGQATEAPAAGTGGLVAGVNEQSEELFPDSSGQVVSLTVEEACAMLDDVLLSAVVVAEPTDTEALRAELTSTSDPEDVLRRVADYGPQAQALSADVVSMIGSQNERVDDAAFAVLVASDPEAAVAEGRRILSDPDSPLATQYIAAAALTRVGPAGLQLLTEIALSDAASPPVVTAINRLTSYPGLFPAIFADDGVCGDVARFDACQVVAIDVLLPVVAERVPMPSYVDLSDPHWALLVAEAGVMAAGRDGSAWATASAAEGVDAQVRLDSLIRLRSAGFQGALGPAALAILFDAETPARNSTMLTFWLLSMVDDALIEASTTQLAEHGADSTVLGALTAATAIATLDGPVLEGDVFAGVTNAILTTMAGTDASLRALATALAVHYGIDGGEPAVRAAFSSDTPDALWALADSGAISSVIAPYLLVLWARTHREGEQAVAASLEGRRDMGPEGQAAAWLGNAGQAAATEYVNNVPRSIDVAIGASRVADLAPQVADWLGSPRSMQRFGMQAALVTDATVDVAQVLNVLMTPDPPGFLELDATTMREMAAAVLMMETLPINELIAQRVSGAPTRAGFRELGTLISANRSACEGQ